jgi:hypothetical protein
VVYPIIYVVYPIIYRLSETHPFDAFIHMG